MGRNSCCVKQKLRKGLWSPHEDEKLYNQITRFGVGCWSSVPKLADLQRCGKSCRSRWINYLRPDLKRGMFSQQEENLIFSLHELLGNRWAQIAAQMPGRTDNEIKNYWNSSLRKKLIKQGLDPNTHKPPIENEMKNTTCREKSSWSSTSTRTTNPRPTFLVSDSSYYSSPLSFFEFQSNVDQIMNQCDPNGIMNHHDQQSLSTFYDHKLFDDDNLVNFGDQPDFSGNSGRSNLRYFKEGSTSTTTNSYTSSDAQNGGNQNQMVQNVEEATNCFSDETLFDQNQSSSSSQDFLIECNFHLFHQL